MGALNLEDARNRFLTEMSRKVTEPIPQELALPAEQPRLQDLDRIRNEEPVQQQNDPLALGGGNGPAAQP